MLLPNRNGNSPAYRYGFNGMEKDDDIKGTGNSYDFGARIYDPRVGRWLSLDPLAGKFVGMSPYNAMGNNPIMFIDPDGKDIIIPKNKNDKYASTNAKKILANLQKLTSDKLDIKSTKIKYKGKIIEVYKVVISGSGANDGELKEGSRLVENLIGQNKNIMVQSTKGANVTTKYENGSSEIKINLENEADGDKGANDPYKNFVANEDGTNGRPVQVGLAHELLHAEDNLDGTDTTEVKIKNSDGPDGFGKVVKVTKEELSVREKEQVIRDEQNVVKRKESKVVKSKEKKNGK